LNPGKVKQSTSLLPHAFVAHWRMEQAQELMAAHPAMGLTEIALCVGYQSQAAFGAAFKRVTGTTPSQWRRGRLR
jgi:AraC family transcriptional regulator